MVKHCKRTGAREERQQWSTFSIETSIRLHVPKVFIIKNDAQNLDYAHHFVLGKNFVEIFRHLNFRYTIREVFGRNSDILHNFSEQLFYRALLMVASNSFFFFYNESFRLDFYILTLFWNNSSPWQYLIHSCPLQSFLIFPK